MEEIKLLFTLAVLSFGMALIWIYYYQERRQEILERVGAQKKKRREAGELPDWLLKLAKDSIPSGERYTPKGQREKIERWLEHAGHPFDLDVPTFLGLRFVVIFAALLLSVLLAFLLSPKLFPLIMLLGYYAPVWWLKAKAEERQAEIEARLPDFMESLAVSLRAGTGFYPTLRKVAQRFGGPLGAEFMQVVLRIEMGQPMVQALRSLRNRTTVRDLDLCIDTITQALELGVPIADTLAAQASVLRRGRVQRAKEKAAKASPKITMLTTFLVTPGVLLLLVGMVLLNMYYHPDVYGVEFLFQ